MREIEPKRSPLIGHPEAAEYLGVAQATLHGFNYHRIGPRSYKVGRLRKYRMADLDAWLEERASDARPAA